MGTGFRTTPFERAQTRKRVGRMSQMGNALDTDIQSTGMIQPGAHPEFEAPTPLDNAEAFFGRAMSGALKAAQNVGTSVGDLLSGKRRR